MEDIQGLWVVQYAGLNGDDAGVVTLVNGQVLGGDNAFVYSGSYKHRDNEFSAQITVTNYNPKIMSVFGITATEYTLKASLTWQEDGTMKGNASLLEPEGEGILIKMTKYADLY